MKCPCCLQFIHRQAEICPHCSFSYRDLLPQWRRSEQARRPILDLAGVFRPQEISEIQRNLQKLHHRFPQLSLSVIIVPSVDDYSLVEEAFLWLNQPALGFDHQELVEDGGMVLLMDLEKQSAIISYGYFWEGVVDDLLLFSCLRSSYAEWQQKRYVTGVKRFVFRLQRCLARQFKRGLVKKGT